jgi:hypothetical protein
VNADGFDDVLVLSSYAQDDVLYLGTSGGLAPAPFQTLPSTSDYLHGSDDLGGGQERHVAAHGCDLDGDAYLDVLVSRLVDDSLVVYLELFHGSAAGLTARSVFRTSIATASKTS